MALEVVGGAFLSAFLQVVFQKMGSREVLDFLRGKKVTNALLKKLKITLLSVTSVLDDAEKKQLSNSTVRQWLDELKEAVYDAEDLLVEIKTEALRRKLEVEPARSSSTSKVQDFISGSFQSFDLALNSRIEEILHRLDFISKQKNVLNLKPGARHRISQLPSTSLVEDCGVYGRDEEKETFIRLLLSEDVTGNKISVIPIVGMGGIGKTTFAQFIYNDERVKQHFDLQAWVCITEEFDVLRTTQTIYESITSKTCDITNLDLLQLKLKEALMGKKFLFVHDDVWNENYMHWDFLKRPFEYGLHGSRIIVTTRNEGVASKMGTLQTHRLMQLSEEDCWKLFAKHAFKNAGVCVHPNLEVTGRQIVRKCKGLPLAAKSLGGVLRSKLKMEEWENVLNSDIWDLPHEDNNILPALWLSYHYLPPHMKRCFAYCSVFPKGYEFEKSELVRLWMAEDLLQPVRNKMIEEVGEEYFDDLISKSFFQSQVHTHSVDKSYFILHDLISDLAKFVSGEFCVRWEENGSLNIVSSTRHFSYMGKSGYGFEKFEALYEAKYLHTFLSLPLRQGDGCFGEFKMLDNVLHDLLPKLQYLRVLNLSGYDMRELPNSIDNLKHLRHLDMSNTCIEKLPDTICSLYNLQTLLLSNCKALAQLPTNLGKLINLRHLSIEGTKLENMPPHMGKLKDLQILSDFVLDKHTTRCDVLELKELQHLHGTLRISGLHNIVHADDALLANMSDKKYLNELILQWGPSVPNDSQTDREVLAKLQPCRNLKKLRIYCYGSTRFPGWLGDSSSTLVCLGLYKCINCYSLPPLGQLPFLRELDIRGLKDVVTIGPHFYGDNTSVPFRSLQVLRFHDMDGWKEWSYVRGGSEGGVFPNLCDLTLWGCEKLTGRLPLDYFPKLQTLILRVTNLEITSARESQLLSLRTLRMSDCPHIVLFPDGGLHAPNLTMITIYECKKLRSLPEEMYTLLPSLQSLWIRHSPELESFPEGGLPLKLESLGIFQCKKLIANRMQWGLQRLTSLTELSLGFKECEEVDSFPEEGLLPTTLTSLWISDHLNLRTIDGEVFKYLNSLDILTIGTCPELQCLPNEGLPSSLSHLRIKDCPLLTQRCQRETGEDWPKIAHIPNIMLDWTCI